MKRTLTAICLSLAIVCGLPACDALKDNGGSNLTTDPNQQLTAEMFKGKWDLDGERTNAANGISGISSIPSDVAKDIFGKGWRFSDQGVLLTDKPLGAENGSWRIEGNNTLVVKETPSAIDRRFAASFRSGFMYLKQPDGKWLVFEKDKFFGF